MKIDRIDHLVLTVKDIDATCTFYTSILGMELETFGEGRKALKFGNQKLNLHQKGKEFEPKAYTPTPGAIDICFITTDNIEQLKAELENKNIQTQGIFERTGATGKIRSIYFRDPDQNLIEVSNYL
ncbi:VOC family protein [Mucilaginibacter lappiensis]|uniref:Catechol 2,3-dioxygenase-like lactoylglutathione lyase family enzyme n=1 Tax=Mucilaginibacter lappiensis TaxID=354630 RepID=A0A1N7GBM3_9SPHI|nr:VOC family protein [Mucilaginibacter lappiensis]MBB6112963.1 catechol 2,3-dioxygenase-like lactoylglutathione lyase family enzyme [Mucilaginibacter lappiensis]MBB6131675.1 catechol 2,3-dioxygenase-like lactoylglutathione lyase family enzyme [Mucilaginibacter lappiensis]SIS09979.1 Catechol 2,3-dioxygenase [Mucilaginibacter lappiensis]